MPRKVIACWALGIALEDRCAACIKPAAKRKCMGNGGRQQGPQHQASSSLTRPPPRSYETVDDADGADEESCSGEIDQGAEDLVLDRPASKRQRKAPAMYEPDDFWRRQLPEVPADKGTQRSRTRELNDEKKQKEKELYEQGVHIGKIISKAAIDKLDKLLAEANHTIESKGKELAKLRAEQRRVKESKRQLTLSNWFKRTESERPNLQLPSRKSHFEANLENATGYNATEVRRTFRAHVQRIEEFIESITDEPIKQLQLADAVNRRFAGIRSSMPNDDEAASYVLESLRNFESTLRERYAGRYPNEIRAAHQAVAAAIVSKVPQRKLSVVADATGMSLEALADGRRRWALWFDGTADDLIELRGKIRSDKIPEEWVVFAAAVWKEATRPAPSTKCSVRNPHNRSDKERYRIHYLDMRIGDMVKLIQTRGKEKFSDADPSFHLSWWYCIKVRPFFVKAAGRETSVCIYHLRFDLLVEALYVFYKRLRDSNLCHCCFTNIKHPADFRRILVCQRAEGSKYDNNDCVTTACVTCGELQQFPICGCIDLDSTNLLIRWEEYQKIEYKRKDGSMAEKKDFVVVNTPFQAFLEHFAGFWATFAIHHQTARLQDDDIRYVKQHPERGTVSDVEDFSENDHIKPKREHATRYFTEVGYTLFGMVLTGHLDDFTNISEAHREELRRIFDERKLPPAITESHIVISGDLVHDAAAVVHYNDKILTPYIKTNMPNVTKRIRITDGAPQHFKLADLALWTSKQQVETGILSENLFGATAHRKDLSDSECGGAKHAVHRVQMGATEGETSKVKVPYDAFLIIRDEYGKLTHERFLKQKGVGIYRRFIYWVPATGVGSIDRNIQSCKTLATKELGGIKSLHQLCDVGIPGQLQVRQCSCHSCDACKIRRFDQCTNFELLGPMETITLHPESGQSVRLTRNALSELGVSLSKQVQPKEIIGVELEGVNESFMLAEVVSPAPYTVETAFESYMGTFRTGDVVLDVRKLEPISLGSSVYEFTDKTFPVFVEDIRKRNMQRHLEEVDLSRRSARVAETAAPNAPSQRQLFRLSPEGSRDLMKLTAAGEAELVDRRNLNDLAQ